MRDAGLEEITPLHRPAQRRSHLHRAPRLPAHAPTVALPRTLRVLTYWVCGALWVSGGLWLLLHYLLPARTDFGPAPNPAEPTLLKVHGWLAMGGVFLLGWLGSSHMLPRWPQWRQRTSGLVLATACGVLVLTGYGLYYSSDPAHRMISLLHQVLGVAAFVIAVLHWERPLRRAGDRRVGNPPI